MSVLAAVVALCAVSVAVPSSTGATPAPSSGSTAGTGAAVAAPGPGAPAALPRRSANQPFALQLLERFGPDASGATDAAASPLAAELDAGTPVASVVAGVARSPLAVSPIMEEAFSALLDRAPDQGGQDYFAGRIAADASIEWMLAAVAASPEFATTRPSSAERVEAVYQAMLERTADAEGSAYFTARLDAGLSPAGLVAVIGHSAEYGGLVTAEAYQRVLWRSPDAGGGAYWAAVAASAGALAVQTALGASAESVGAGCDPIAGGSCMLPWPNDHYTRADATTATGRRVNLKASHLPANVSGVHMDPSQSNRSDGFSPGSSLLVQIPGVDPEASGFPTIDHLDRNGATASVVLVDTVTGEIVPTWAELDVHDPYDDPAEQLLMIHPVRNLADGHRHVVGLRNVKDSAGRALEAPPVFRAYRDGIDSDVAGFAQRRDHFETIFADLAAVGFERSSAFLAWDFTVASTPNLTGRMVHIRDDAFAHLGSAAPAFSVTSVQPGTRAGTARVVEGTFEVPNYLTGTGAPGATFEEDATGLPVRNGTFTAVFRCVIPEAALSSPARPSLYGHGLFGSVAEVTAGNIQDMAAEHNMVFCGSNWVGMSTDDVGTAAGILGDLSLFPRLADRMQQGVLNFLFLGRLMKMSPGLAADPAFRNDAGDSVLAAGELYYDGNSQGGIAGGMLTAVATDLTRSVLGVPGMNYSLLLPRSVDFEPFEAIMTPAYPSQLDRMLGLAAVQLQWDRAEPNGYANHITDDPLPGTPRHSVLLQVALGDHQVSNYTADTMARTVGARAHCPAFDPGRVPDTRLLWDIDCLDAASRGGSAIMYFDSGVPLPELTNTMPPEGHDPHEDPRHDADARRQKSAFLQPEGTSQVIDVCDGAACHVAWR